MRDLSLKIILNEGAVTRVIKFPGRATCADACRLVQEKVLTGEDGKDFGLFLPSADDVLSGIWLDDSQPLTHYLLRDGDSLHYRSRVRTLRLRTLDGAVKTMQVDESKPVESLMMSICARLGITNYEEYGLCREDEPEEVTKPSTGTLTLKRKPKTREKDHAMDQLSKKLKTDDNVEWLEQHKTLRESNVPPLATLLLARRLFYSDRKVDTRDPTQLRLLYVQARDGVLAGRHPVTEARAVEFAGIQCQIQFGDHQENKHKPGFIEDLTEFLPLAYAGSRGVEKKILKEHRKHAGLSEVEAQLLYTKTVRGLPTYGVTFFLVKEILEGKKKLVPRLLGISANAVLRMDENTKEVLNEWPLTQVRTYKAGKGELFTLNFGDYSEKEYCVKTNDAYRIRDILQSYIDLIRKKMAAPFNTSADEGGAIYTATVESCKGTTMEVVSHGANKAVETTFVGPSRIITYEHGSKAQAQGAQIMTAQQVIVMSQNHNQQTALAGGVALRNANDLSAGAVRRLNDLNGAAVRVVELLTERSDENVSEAKKIIEGIEEGMPELVEGIKQCIEKQTDDQGRQLLTSQLQDLQDTIAQLVKFESPSEAKEAAMRVADLTTQMYFALDPRTQRRSQLVKLSRKSFVEDERTQANLQRASLINTVAATGEAIGDARGFLLKQYEGRPLTPEEVMGLERSARDRLAKLNAAIALFVAAHSDPKNIDYAAAVNSMNTIKELMPELAKDMQALSAVEDGTDRSQLLQEMKDLCDAAELICRHTGCDDLEKLHGAADDYAKKSKRLLFTLSRREPPPQENEILESAKEADEKARLLLSTATQLATHSDGYGAETLRAASDRCGHAASGLRACVELTAPSIHEPHCRSALIAACEDLASSARALANACGPLTSPEDQDVLKQQLNDLLKALERLNNASSDVDSDSPEGRERRRLQFTNTLSDAQAALVACDAILNDEKAPAAPDSWLGDSLPKRLAALDAAVASLLKATRDSENPDYEAAEAAMATIQSLMPGVVRDVKWDSHRLPESRRRELQADLRALLDALQALAQDTSDGKDPSDSVAEFARASGKLEYVFDPRAKPDREHRIIELAKSSCEMTSELLAPVHRVAEAAPAERGAALDAVGSQVADYAQSLLTTALLTAPTSHIPPAKDALTQSAQDLMDAMERLAHAWATAQPDQKKELDARKNIADEEIKQLLAALNELPDELSELKEDPMRQKKRVRFMFSLSQTGDAVDTAAKDIDKAVSSPALSPAQAARARRSLADKLAALNAALAALAAATKDRSNPDYEVVERASAVIQQLLPQVIEETKALSVDKDEAERLALLEVLRELCAATKDLSLGAGDYVTVPSDAVERYARAANKLAFVCTPRAQAQENQQQVLQKSNEIDEHSRALLSTVEKLPAAVGAAGAARAAAAASRALRDAVRLTSSSLHSPHCRSALLEAASALSQAVAKLDEACGGQASGLASQRAAFDKAVEELMESIRRLEGSQDVEEVSSEQEHRRLKFLATQKATQNALDDAMKELAKVGKSAPLAPPQASALQLSLSDRLATLNAAVAASLPAMRDAENPDYSAAESATATIQELMPDLVKDAKTLSASKDPTARAQLLENLRALCEATRALNCGELLGKEEELNDAVKKFTTASGNLVYTFNPGASTAKEDQIIDLSKSVCEKTSELLAQVYEVTEQVGGERASALDSRGARVADAAQSLLTTAEITAPSIASPLCQSSLLASVDGLSSSVEQLALSWQEPHLDVAKTRLDEAIARLRDAIRSGHVKGKTPPPVPTRPDSMKVRARAGNEPAAVAATKDFLDTLRMEASSEGSYEREKSPAAARSEEEKRAKSRFGKSVEDARKSIRSAEESLSKYLHSESKPRASLDERQVGALSQQAGHKLARANAAAARLLASRSGEKSDYIAATKCVGALSDLVPTIVTDTKTLGDLKDAQARKAFFDDTLGLCTASLNLCDTAKSDKKKLNDSALAFGNQSSKLLYAINTDVDPTQENEVLSRVRLAGDAAARLTGCGAERRACAGVATAATVLMYTAKLVAPSIQDPECQDALISASKELSTQLRTFPTDQSELSAELVDLEKLLEALRGDVAAGKFVKRREKLLIEDTPLKMLTEQIIEYTKQKAESESAPAAERRALAAFANKLTDALAAFDVANARCKNAPRDMKRRGELEDAVYQLQHLVLQERPGASRDKIVDLADYLTAVSSDAAHLLLAAQSPGPAGGPAARAAAAVGDQAERICSAADNAHTVGGDVNHAAQECVSRVQKINTAVECCAEGVEKDTLKKEARPLNESCALLQFAAQAGSATAQCVALDEAMSDLAELETRIDDMLLPGEGYTPVQSSPYALAYSRARLCAATMRSARARDLAPALARYAADLRARVHLTDPTAKRRLADHLKKLQEHLELLVMETGRRLQTWQPVRGSTLPADQVLQELDNMEAVIGFEPGTTAARVAKEDLRKLLLPTHSYAVEGDSKQMEAKLESSATKLNSMVETIALSVGKPEALARTAHVTAESAVQLAAIARAMKTDEDPSKSSKIEEASQELCFVTYNLLKTAESVSQEPNSFDNHRRLYDASRALTDAINKLVKTSSNADKLHKECNELSRSLQLPGLQARPTCVLSYGDCMAAIHTQHDTIQNLKSDKPMSREEFSTSLRLLSSAVCTNVEYAEHCAYLLSIADQHPALAKEGLFDAPRVQGLIAAAQDTCFRATHSSIEHQAKEESLILSKDLADLKEAVEESFCGVKDAAVKQQLLEASSRVDDVGARLQAVLNTENVTAEKLIQPALAAVGALSALEAVTRHPSLAPQPQGANKQAGELLDHSKELVGRATALMRAVKMADSQQAMTWVMFNTYTKGVVDASDHLITCLRTNGQNAGVLEATMEVEEETDVAFKSYVQTQVAIASKWLSKPAYKPQIKADGQAAARNVIDVGNKMATHVKDGEAEEIRHLVEECEQLLTQCLDKYDLDTGSFLMGCLKDLARAVDRCVVAMVVEDLMEEEQPMADLDILIEAETDEAKRKFVLERKIKELLAHLARVTKTARALADGRGSAPELIGCADQASLLAPMLVKAAEKRVIFPKEKAVVEDYQRQLAQYSESLSRVRDLCDRAVDPMQFVQTAEEKMQRMKEESTVHQNDLLKCSNTSNAIRNLAHRVIRVGMSAAHARRDPELARALAQAQRRLKEAEPERTLRASRMPDWNHSIAEILRATGEVESVLGGEMIFNKLPESNQPIYNAARNLHAAVREWSARDNEIVSEAKRMAVLMAKLSDYMHADKKREVISTSRAIVESSREVARLACKLAQECSDHRIRTNLLLLSDQILTISAQLKMLVNVKKSSFGHQGEEEDIEAMNMLVGNAQNLMLTIQNTVDASFGASVHIRSKLGGPRIRWVRKDYRPDAQASVLTF